MGAEKVAAMKAVVMASTLRYSKKDVVLSIRLDHEIVSQLDELAMEMERSRANLIARAVRESSVNMHRLPQCGKPSASSMTARVFLRKRLGFGWTISSPAKDATSSGERD